MVVSLKLPPNILNGMGNDDEDDAQHTHDFHIESLIWEAI